MLLWKVRDSTQSVLKVSLQCTLDLRAYNLVSESINCGFGIGKSELYLRIELLGSDKYVKTNGISSSEPEWEEKLIL